MMGYIGDPVNTARAFTRDGYLKTGDMGYINEVSCSCYMPPLLID